MCNMDSYFVCLFVPPLEEYTRIAEGDVDTILVWHYCHVVAITHLRAGGGVHRTTHATHASTSLG